MCCAVRSADREACQHGTAIPWTLCGTIAELHGLFSSQMCWPCGPCANAAAQSCHGAGESPLSEGVQRSSLLWPGGADTHHGSSVPLYFEAHGAGVCVLGELSVPRGASPCLSSAHMPTGLGRCNQVMHARHTWSMLTLGGTSWQGSSIWIAAVHAQIIKVEQHPRANRCKLVCGFRLEHTHLIRWHMVHVTRAPVGTGLRPLALCRVSIGQLALHTDSQHLTTTLSTFLERKKNKKKSTKTQTHRPDVAGTHAHQWQPPLL
jgi:hypothetical protein